MITDNFFTIAIDTCNHEKWIANCIDSCLNQKYTNYEIIIVDALSDDKTYDICLRYENKYQQIKVTQNKIRQPQVANFILLSELAKAGSIIVSVDGDDWLKNENVLNTLNTYYTDDVWMTYGTYEEYPYRDVSQHYHEYPKSIIEANKFREYKWLASHLRTFRKDLILKIQPKDLKYENGEWLITTGDQAIMLPMLEMSGTRSRYIKDILYTYNVSDNNRDSATNELKQIELANYIRGKHKYIPLKKL